METSEMMNEVMYYNFRKKRHIQPSGLEGETHASRLSRGDACVVIRKTCHIT